jgi:hypothetical protein
LAFFCASGDVAVNGEEKFLIDVALVPLTIVIWVRWRRNGPGNHNGEEG